jgi:hypothetical protein
MRTHVLLRALAFVPAMLVATEAPPRALVESIAPDTRRVEVSLGMRGIEGMFLRARGDLRLQFMAFRLDADWGWLDGGDLRGTAPGAGAIDVTPTGLLNLGLSPGFILKAFSLSLPMEFNVSRAGGESASTARFGLEGSLSIKTVLLHLKLPELLETDRSRPASQRVSAWVRWLSPTFADPYGDVRFMAATGFTGEPTPVFRAAIAWLPTLRKSKNALRLGLDLSIPVDESPQPLFGFSLRVSPKGPWRIDLSAREWVPRWWEWGVGLAYESGSP